MRPDDFIYPTRFEDRDRLRWNSFAEKAEMAAAETRFAGSEIESVWPMYDEGLEGDSSFNADFACVLPDGKDLKTYLSELFAGKTNLIGLEAGGPGIKLFRELGRDFFEKTAGITLVKPLSEEDKTHAVFAQDLDNPYLFEHIDAWLDRKPIDVWVERMGGGLRTVTQDPYELAAYFNEWYKRVAFEGVMFAEIPRFLVPLMPAFMEVINPFVESGTLEIALGARHLEAVIDGETHASEEFAYFMRLQKHAGAPEQLPLLDARTVRKSYSNFKQNPHAVFQQYRRP